MNRKINMRMTGVLTWPRRIRRVFLRFAQPHDLDDLKALLPKAHFESTPPWYEVVIYTGWNFDDNGNLLTLRDHL